MRSFQLQTQFQLFFIAQCDQLQITLIAVVLHCPIHRTPCGVHGLTELDLFIFAATFRSVFER